MICPNCCTGQHSECVDTKKKDTRLYRSCPCLHKTPDRVLSTQPKPKEAR